MSFDFLLPPVIALIKKGEEKEKPRNEVERLTCEMAISEKD
ncbi:hypothetical protein DAT606_0383 [Melissococcus plutonius]|nr:hypothetical protein DAT606_0383 [Melissococcus plutonius]BBP06978.1 hypothetical protein DAT1033_0383 [Melissococcus plutonius]